MDFDSIPMANKKRRIKSTEKPTPLEVILREGTSVTEMVTSYTELLEFVKKADLGANPDITIKLLDIQVPIWENGLKKKQKANIKKQTLYIYQYKN